MDTGKETSGFPHPPPPGAQSGQFVRVSEGTHAGVCGRVVVLTCGCGVVASEASGCEHMCYTLQLMCVESSVSSQERKGDLVPWDAQGFSMWICPGRGGQDGAECW